MDRGEDRPLTFRAGATDRLAPDNVPTFDRSVITFRHPGDMASEAESKLRNTYGWPVEEIDFGRQDEPDIDGCVLVNYVGEGVTARVAARPGLSEERRAGFAAWALQILENFIEHGPEFDGWQKRSDEGWQLWGRVHELPPLD